MTTTEGFIHMSYSDLLRLRAPNEAARTTARHHLDLVRSMSRSFFDHALKGAAAGPETLPSQGYQELTIETSSAQASAAAR